MSEDDFLEWFICNISLFTVYVNNPPYAFYAQLLLQSGRTIVASVCDRFATRLTVLRATCTSKIRSGNGELERTNSVSIGL